MHRPNDTLSRGYQCLGRRLLLSSIAGVVCGRFWSPVHHGVAVVMGLRYWDLPWASCDSTRLRSRDRTLSLSRFREITFAWAFSSVFIHGVGTFMGLRYWGPFLGVLEQRKSSTPVAREAPLKSPELRVGHLRHTKARALLGERAPIPAIRPVVAANDGTNWRTDLAINTARGNKKKSNVSSSSCTAHLAPSV